MPLDSKGVGASTLIESAEKVKPTGPYVSAFRNQEEKEGKLLFPVIAIPVQSKDNSTFACPNTTSKGSYPKLPKFLLSDGKPARLTSQAF